MKNLANLAPDSANSQSDLRRVLYVERKRDFGVSIENVFRQVASGLSPSRFQADFQQAPYGTGLFGLIRNLIAFKPRPADIYHITGEVHYLAFLLPRERTALTVHDLRFLHDRKGLRRFLLKKLFLDWPIKRLRYITAISPATRDEILRHTACDPAKVEVIENPLREIFIAASEKPFEKEQPVILHIGITPNKNIPNLIRAIEGLPCRLVIIGVIEDVVRKLLERHNIDFENRPAVTDAELVQEYERADIVAFASTYEGFGLPIIEAQAMRKAVVTSDLSPMREVAGGGAILVDPYDPTSIRRGIEAVIHDDALRAEIIETGVRNLQRFSPAAASAKYEALYERILSDSRQ